MTYQEKKSEKFAEYCKDGKMKLVIKWIDNPNVNINWNYHSALRRSIRNGQLEIVKILLDRDELDTDYSKKELHTTNMVVNPFTEAMRFKDYSMIKLLIESGKFNIFRKENLEALKTINNRGMIDYMLTLEGFEKFVMEHNEYWDLINKQLNSLFLV